MAGFDFFKSKDTLLAELKELPIEDLTLLVELKNTKGAIAGIRKNKSALLAYL